MNASDDRTSRVVEERIRNALDSTSLSLGWSEKEKRLDNNGNGGGGGGARPTCVVVDEIDGAANGGDSVSFRPPPLLKFCLPSFYTSEALLTNLVDEIEFHQDSGKTSH